MFGGATFKHKAGRPTIRATTRMIVHRTKNFFKIYDAQRLTSIVRWPNYAAWWNWGRRLDGKDLLRRFQLSCFHDPNLIAHALTSNWAQYAATGIELHAKLDTSSPKSIIRTMFLYSVFIWCGMEQTRAKLYETRESRKAFPCFLLKSCDVTQEI